MARGKDTERDFADVNFQNVGQLEPKRDHAGNFIEYYPQYSGGHPEGLELNKYGDKTFCHFSIGKNWNVAGVFVLTESDEVNFVGKTEDLNQQFGNERYGMMSPSDCYSGGRVTACKLNSLILEAAKNGKTISLWLHRETNKNLQLKIRKRIREFYVPPWNG